MTKKLNVKVFSDGAVLETMLKDLQKVWSQALQPIQV